MNEVIQAMLKKYPHDSLEAQEHALKEIIQEIALLGLWRAKFFEHAAFFGGTALRIFHGLDRFSEDLDFSLLSQDDTFSWDKYLKAIATELNAFDFDVNMEKKDKSVGTTVMSAFIKANTQIHFLKIGAPWKTHKNKSLKIKLEIETDCPYTPETQDLQIFLPIPFSVKLMTLPELFSGKLHAVLCRQRVVNIKGRDWYDFLWYVARQTPVKLNHLEKRMRQSGHWNTSDTLSLERLKQLLREKVASSDIELWKNDVAVFIQNQDNLRAWNKPTFLAAIERLQALSH